MKRKVAIVILSTFTPLSVAPFVGQSNENVNEIKLVIVNKEDVPAVKVISPRKELYIKSKDIELRKTESEEETIESTDNVEIVETEEIIYQEECNPYLIGWLNTDSNFRKMPVTDRENIITTLNKNTEILYVEYDEDWYSVKIGETFGYIWKPLVSSQPINYEIYTAPQNDIKTYMPYTSITSKVSKQYKLQTNAYTGEYGIRQVNGRFCIALGSAYTTQIGQHIDLVLKNGEIIKCVLADCKADEHTNSSNTITKHDGSLVEFVVDTRELNKEAKLTGDISNVCENWKSFVESIIVYEESEEF